MTPKQMRQAVRAIITDGELTTKEATDQIAAILDDEVERRTTDINATQEHKQMASVAKVSGAFTEATKDDLWEKN